MSRASREARCCLAEQQSPGPPRLPLLPARTRSPPGLTHKRRSGHSSCCCRAPKRSLRARRKKKKSASCCRAAPSPPSPRAPPPSCLRLARCGRGRVGVAAAAGRPRWRSAFCRLRRYCLQLQQVARRCARAAAPLLPGRPLSGLPIAGAVLPRARTAASPWCRAGQAPRRGVPVPLCARGTLAPARRRGSTPRLLLPGSQPPAQAHTTRRRRRSQEGLVVRRRRAAELSARRKGAAARSRLPPSTPHPPATPLPARPG